MYAFYIFCFADVYCLAIHKIYIILYVDVIFILKTDKNSLGFFIPRNQSKSEVALKENYDPK